MHNDMKPLANEAMVLEQSLPKAKEIWRRLYPDCNQGLWSTAWKFVVRVFRDGDANVQPCDCRYHNIEHTLRASLCYVHILEGAWRAQELPEKKLASLGLIAVLFHDTGYLKDKKDQKGTGAKHTRHHPERSARFFRDWAMTVGMNSTDLKRVEKFINITDLINETSIGNQLLTDSENQIRYMVGSADLIGQIADPGYPFKLQDLFGEFQEATAHDPSLKCNFPDSYEMLLRSTRGFYEHFVQELLNKEYRGICHLLKATDETADDFYAQSMERNIEYIDKMVTDLEEA